MLAQTRSVVLLLSPDRRSIEARARAAPGTPLWRAAPSDGGLLGQENEVASDFAPEGVRRMRCGAMGDELFFVCFQGQYPASDVLFYDAWSGRPVRGPRFGNPIDDGACTIRSLSADGRACLVLTPDLETHIKALHVDDSGRPIMGKTIARVPRDEGVGVLAYSRDLVVTTDYVQRVRDGTVKKLHGGILSASILNERVVHAWASSVVRPVDASTGALGESVVSLFDGAVEVHLHLRRRRTLVPSRLYARLSISLYCALCDAPTSPDTELTAAHRLLYARAAPDADSTPHAVARSHRQKLVRAVAPGLFVNAVSGQPLRAPVRVARRRLARAA
jgi:hypothetical protein